MRVRDGVTIDVEGEKRPFKIENVAEVSATFHILRTQYTVLAETLYAILCKQVEEKKLTKDDFFDGLRGDALEAAGKALEEELIDFFPQRRRPLARLTAEAHEQRMEAVIAEAVAQMREAMTAVTPSTTQSGKQPESLESTLESGLSDSLLPHAMPV
jgi:hypothetical protein